MARKPKCSNVTCFQYNAGHCELLTKPIKKDPCPFNKTQPIVNEGRWKAHQKLIDNNRFDLIEKYEYNEKRKGVW